jgi:hypothetical protein
VTITNVACKIIITLLTNTVEVDNGVKGCEGFGLPHNFIVPAVFRWPPDPPHECVKPVEPTERTVTETVTQRIEVVFLGDIRIGWNAEVGDPIVEKRLVSKTTKRYRRSEQWVEVKPEPPVTFHTNQFQTYYENVWINRDQTNWLTITNR